jgi:hypothetical protein
MSPLLLFFTALLQTADTGDGRLTCRVTPRVIEVGAFYNGASVRVEGVAAPRSKVIVTVAGSDREERFNRKARFGPVWINAGKVRISGAPSLFLRFSAAPIATLLQRDSVAGRKLDEASVTTRMHIDPPSPDRPGDAALRTTYLALKRTDGIYAFAESGIVMSQSGGDCKYALEFRWPKKAPPAEYEVRAYEVRDGSVIEEASVPLSVLPTGFPAWLAVLAEEHASLYGMAAVVIAALAGFGIDFLTTRIFGKKRSTAH